MEPLIVVACIVNGPCLRYIKRDDSEFVHSKFRMFWVGKR